MMDDEMAEELLRKWGEWSARRETSGLGYPRRCVTFKLESSGNGDTPLHFLPVDSDILRVDRLIASFKSTYPELLEVASLAYITGLPARSIARVARCSVRTVYNRLEMLRNALKRHFPLWKTANDWQ